MVNSLAMISIPAQVCCGARVNLSIHHLPCMYHTAKTVPLRGPPNMNHSKGLIEEIREMLSKATKF